MPHTLEADAGQALFHRSSHNLRSFPEVFHYFPYGMRTAKGIFQRQEKPAPQWDRLCI
jgi:hypothetical protein